MLLALDGVGVVVSFHYVQLLEHITDNMHKNRDQLKEKLITQHVPARYIPPAHNALLL